MKKIASAFILCSSFLTPAYAITHPTWEGIAFVTAVTSACTSNSVNAPGDFYRLIYLPVSLSPDSGVDRISMLQSRSVFLLRGTSTSGSLNGATTYNGLYISSRGFTDSYTATSTLTIKPATVAANTAVVTITGTIANAWNTTGCTLTIKSNLTPRPD